MRPAARILATFLSLITIAAADRQTASAQAPGARAAYSVSAVTVPAVPTAEVNGRDVEPRDVDSLVSFVNPVDSSTFDTSQFQRHLTTELGLDEAPSIITRLKDQFANPALLPAGMSMSVGTSHCLRNFGEYRVLDHVMPGLMDAARTYRVTVQMRF